MIRILGRLKYGGLADASSGPVVPREANFCGMRPPFPASKGEFLPIIRTPACPPLISITGRWKPRFRRENPFRGAFGPETSEKRRKTTPENSPGDPGIALDMVLRGVVLSDNRNYRNPENQERKISRFARVLPAKRFFCRESHAAVSKAPPTRVWLIR